MIYIVLNAWPIAVAALSAVGLGALWYRCPVSTPTLLTIIAAHLWLGAILAGALILAPPKGDVWTMTIGSAFIIWIGFVLPALAASYRLRGLAWRAIAIDAGYWLAAMLLQATLMRMIGLTPPPGG
ncbi:MAG: hypothetical protein ACKVOP_08805 [Sphingomonadaceae bacterium]